MNQRTTMTVEFLGTGGAFANEEQYQNQPLVEFKADEGDIHRMLIDCGGDVRHSLKRAGYTVDMIDSIYISHLHADHIGGLEYVGFARMFSSNPKKPTLFVPELLADRLWDSLRGGMEWTDHGFRQNLGSYFDVELLPETARWYGDEAKGIKFRIQTKIVPHILELNAERHGCSYAVTLATDDRTLFFTTDARHCPEYLMPEYEAADLIFQDCNNYPYKGMNGYPSKSLVHARLCDLETLPGHIKEKMWLCHHTAIDGRGVLDALDAGFLGLVLRGASYQPAQRKEER